MKRSERKHLKTNEVATTIVRVTNFLENRAREIRFVAVALGIILVGLSGYLYWQDRLNTEASELLAEAMAVMRTPVIASTDEEKEELESPQLTLNGDVYSSEHEKLEAAMLKFLATAEAYPSTPAGIAGRYHAAAILTLLERPEDAKQHYQYVIEHGAEDVYHRMAVMGLAELQIITGDHDQAIDTLNSLSSKEEADLPVDAVLMRLGQAYEMAGMRSDALTTYERVSSEFPESPYSEDANREMRRLGQDGSDGNELSVGTEEDRSFNEESRAFLTQP